MGMYALLIFTVIRLLIKKKLTSALLIEQLYIIGVLSLPLVIMTGMATGMVLAAQAYFQLSDKGLASTTGIMVAKSMLVEIGPILTSFMLTGRIGAAITAEIGSMKVSEQLDAMSSLGVSPIEQLVVPRCLAMSLMMPILAIFSSTSGIIGGWIIACKFYGMNTQTFFEPIPIHVNWYDIFANCLKSWIFGLLIVSISCFNGLYVKGGARGVGKATTLSVVLCYTTILLSNFFLTIGLNSSYRYFFGF
jgi:phospholipid/cholesterol/gamma-HCH transport system permease protein